VTVPCELLFVYGSLLSSSSHPMARQLADAATLVGTTRFHGRKYRVDWYSGVVPSETVKDVVTGEVYRLHDAATLLPLLDVYEEAEPAWPAPAEYRRELRQVRMARGGSRVNCWIYLYNRPVAPLERLQ